MALYVAKTLTQPGFNRFITVVLKHIETIYGLALVYQRLDLYPREANGSSLRTRLLVKTNELLLFSVTVLINDT